jgi:clan AA aspartic protease (TIGR02281 family)
LIERLQQENLETEVGELFDARVLIRAGNALLLKDVVNIVVQSRGFESGINLIEDVLAEVNLSSDRKMQDLMQFYAGLYRDWIDILATNGEIQRAWQAWQAGKESLPADPEIHLLGVILALAEEDWAEAEQLLSMREYPSHLRDRVENLRNRISELKGQEGKIVIQFTPGTQQIPVTALLNGSLQQDFIIDTGASMSTIPFATARQLGLSIDSQTPIRKIYTAGGVLEAPEVVLSSITVQGWESRSINALILDIPDQGSWGLLGLNYLRRFRMDLQTDNGLLVLEPR